MILLFFIRFVLTGEPIFFIKRRDVMRENLKKDGQCLGVYITKDMHGKLIERAKQENLSLSDIVRIALREYLAKVA